MELLKPQALQESCAQEKSFMILPLRAVWFDWCGSDNQDSLIRLGMHLDVHTSAFKPIDPTVDPCAGFP